MYLVVMYIVPFTCLAAFNLRIYLQIRVAIQWQGPHALGVECVELGCVLLYFALGVWAVWHAYYYILKVEQGPK